MHVGLEAPSPQYLFTTDDHDLRAAYSAFNYSERSRRHCPPDVPDILHACRSVYLGLLANLGRHFQIAPEQEKQHITRAQGYVEGVGRTQKIELPKIRILTKEVVLERTTGYTISANSELAKIVSSIRKFKCPQLSLHGFVHEFKISNSD